MDKVKKLLKTIDKLNKQNLNPIEIFNRIDKAYRKIKNINSTKENKCQLSTTLKPTQKEIKRSLTP